MSTDVPDPPFSDSKGVTQDGLDGQWFREVTPFLLLNCSISYQVRSRDFNDALGCSRLGFPSIILFYIWGEEEEIVFMEMMGADRSSLFESSLV